jgi:iron(III) transport system permease protein
VASTTDSGRIALADPAARAPARGGHAAPASWPLRVLSAVVAVAFAAPLGYLVVRSAARFGAVAQAWASPQTLGPLARSLGLAAAVSATAALLGAGLAWLVARTDLPGRRLWRVLLPLPLVIPSFIGAFALIAALAPGGIAATLLRGVGVTALPNVRGFWGAFFVLTLLTYPYVYLPVAARLRQLPPSLEESARLLGHSPARTFAAVVVPQARGSVEAGALLVFLYVLSDFGAVQLLRYDTITRAIYAGRVYEPQAALALALLLGVLALAVVAAERALTRTAPPTRAGRGARPLVVPLGSWRVPATAAVVATVALGLAGPLSVLAYWAARGLLRGATRASALVTDVGALAGPALNTAVVSVAAAVVAAVVVLPAAYLTVRHRGRLAGAVNGVVVGGFALPGLVIALAIVFWTLASPAGALVYQTRAVLVFAYVVHFGAQALRAAQVAVATVPPRVEDAARMLGAGRARRLWAVEVPLLLPGLLAGGGLVLLSAAKELPATLLLAPPGFQTLATRVWGATEDAFLADASLAALLLVALTGVLTWLLVLRRADALE